jgi:uncharacterized membrane protein YGL010W
MKTIEEHLTQYAKYHRDPRNIMTHLVGVPMIVLSIILLLSKTLFTAGIPVSISLILIVVSSLYYLKLHLLLGVSMVAYMALAYWVSSLIRVQFENAWVFIAIGLFVVGWIIQFVGHIFEGKKPAFVDDLMGLLIGPVFVLAECIFMVGGLKALKKEIEHGAGVVEIKRG